MTAVRTNEQLHLLLAREEDKNYRQTDELTTTAHPQHDEHWQQPAFKKRLALLLWNHFDSYLKLGEGKKVAMEQISISQQQASTLNKVLQGQKKKKNHTTPNSFSNKTPSSSSSLHLHLLKSRLAGFYFGVFIQVSSQ